MSNKENIENYVAKNGKHALKVASDLIENAGNYSEEEGLQMIEQARDIVRMESQDKQHGQ